MRTFDGGLFLAGGEGADTLTGTARTDVLSGLGGDDFLTGAGGYDLLNGGAGRDIADFGTFGRRSATFSATPSGGARAISVGSQDSALLDIEEVRFGDGRLVFDVADPAAQVVRLYQAAFGRIPDQAGLNTWTANLQKGEQLSVLADGFIGSAEFIARYGSNPSTATFVELLYANALGRPADPAGAAGWVNAIDAGSISRAEALVSFSESVENQARTAPLTAGGIWDISENAAFVARLYDTTLGRLPDLNGLRAWRQVLDGDGSRESVVEGFMGSAEFTARYGAAVSNSDFVELLYVNTLDRPSDAPGKTGWVGALDSGAISRTQAVLGFSESAEHIALTSANIMNENPAQFGILFA